MRIVKYEKIVITKKQLEAELQLKKIHTIELQKDFIKITTKKDNVDLGIYLRCSDLKGLFDLHFNILDTNINFTKDGSIEYFREIELVKTRFNKKKLLGTIKDFFAFD